MKNLKSIIFWGACWGVLEATLGWALHLIHFKGEALILYPFGLMCMMMAFKHSGKTSSVIQVAAVAAIVKLSNLLIAPGTPFYYVTNPAVAIFLEGLVTWAFCIYVKDRKSFSFGSVPFAFLLMITSFFVFRSWQFVMDAYVAYNPSVHIPLENSVFIMWGWRSIVQGLMLVGIYYLMRRSSVNIFSNRWIGYLAFPSLLIAILLNVLI